MSTAAESAVPDNAASSTARATTSQTLDRGLRILELLAAPEHTGGLTISALAAALDTGRPVVYRLVATLVDHSLVTHTDNRVRLGAGLHQLASAVLPVVRERVQPVLAVLADAAGATAHLTVAEGSESVALVVVEPTWTDFHVAYRSGARHPLTQGAAGRAILAARAGEAVLTSSVGELQPGAHGLALAVPAAKGAGPAPFVRPSLEASVGIVSLSPIDIEAHAPAVRAAADALSATLA
ncbi:IclR family transcriptional regulator [Janibacter sp. G1551]|uniref:IclR family transcriptional regulator n=1 Tax=Janibacter sp. G1551 TaxID=3420440 RepID=UPI003D05356E